MANISCKFCGTCHVRKSDFCTKRCKDCFWYSTHKEHKAKYRIDNLEQISNREKSYTVNGRRKEKNLKWYTQHGKAYYAQKRQDIGYKLIKNLRTRTWKALKNNWKSGSTIRDLGCSINEFKQHLESKFDSTMSWNNYGKWEMDHIKPLASFDLSNIEQFRAACHFKNIQPIWKEDHVIKTTKDIATLKGLR